jgi:hypothetical protein
LSGCGSPRRGLGRRIRGCSVAEATALRSWPRVSLMWLQLQVIAGSTRAVALVELTPDEAPSRDQMRAFSGWARRRGGGARGAPPPTTPQVDETIETSSSGGTAGCHGFFFCASQ